MSKVVAILKKFLLVALILGIGLAAFPIASASAAGTYDPSTPPNRPALSNERLERIWARELAIYERQGRLLERADAIISKVQGLIDRANEMGLDTSAAQAALDDFEDAVREAHAAHQRANGIVNSHQGFNAEGKVTDRDKAIETIKEMASALREFRSIIREPAHNLRMAIRALREQMKSAVTPAP